MHRGHHRSYCLRVLAHKCAILDVSSAVLAGRRATRTWQEKAFLMGQLFADHGHSAQWASALHCGPVLLTEWKGQSYDEEKEEACPPFRLWKISLADGLHLAPLGPPCALLADGNIAAFH